MLVAFCPGNACHRVVAHRDWRRPRRRRTRSPSGRCGHPGWLWASRTTDTQTKRTRRTTLRYSVTSVSRSRPPGLVGWSFGRYPTCNRSLMAGHLHSTQRNGGKPVASTVPAWPRRSWTWIPWCALLFLTETGQTSIASVRVILPP